MRFRQISSAIISIITSSTPTSATSATLFQPDIARSGQVFDVDGLLCFSLESYRTKSRDVDFDDLNTDDIDPKESPPTELLTNDIPTFPFPSVCSHNQIYH